MSDETPTKGQSGQLSEVTHAEARQILSRFNASHWKHLRPTEGEVARYSIPADPRRDDDIRLGAYIAQNENEQERLRGLLRRLRDFCEYVCDIDRGDHCPPGVETLRKRVDGLREALERIAVSYGAPDNRTHHSQCGHLDCIARRALAADIASL
jgi:hypothetical protein